MQEQVHSARIFSQVARDMVLVKSVIPTFDRLHFRVLHCLSAVGVLKCQLAEPAVVSKQEVHHE